jgi:4-hydroxybenzoate polyprenyltransferase
MRLAEARGLLAGALAAYLAACWALDPAGFLYLRLAAIPIVVFTLYPYAKRFTPFCHLGVGAGIGLALLLRGNRLGHQSFNCLAAFEAGIAIQQASGPEQLDH